MLCLAALSMQAQSYVDLGLSSGTKWKTSNEKNSVGAEYAFFYYYEATAKFGNNLPSREQWMELVNECEWTWTGMGYKVVGPNGNFISLPAAGIRDCDGSVGGTGTNGEYWSSTLSSESAWSIDFYQGSVKMYDDTWRCIGQSVRLVQN